MTQWITGEYEFGFITPSREQLRHALSKENCLWGEAEYPGADDRDEWWSEDAEEMEPTPYDHRVWWWWREDCPEDEECRCGQVSLLLVLEHLDPQDRGNAVTLHAEEMRNLYEHFWAGQGLVSGASGTIGEACSSCLTEGAAHVWEIYEAACELAEEFGEALAAYAYQLFVGEPRHHLES
jgi:hypothetical protein